MSMDLNVFLSISVTGMLIAPRRRDEETPDVFDPDATGIINFHTMRLISMAAVRAGVDPCACGGR